MTTKTVITPTHEMFAPGGGPSTFERFQYSAAVRANGLLFVAGQIGLNPDGTTPDDDETQFVNAFERLGQILTEAGAGFPDIVDVVTYHVGIHDHFADFIKVKERYIPEPFPAWTAIGVQGLARPGLVIEIKAVALAG